MILVFTNGVFDIIHSGHIRLLKYARSLGDRLVVGINSDASVRRIKCSTRPIQDQNTRRAILEEMRCVDEVHIFNKDTPETLIHALRPDILVKGPQELGKEIPGAKFVLSYGGKVIVPDWPISESTSQIIERIQNDKT